MKPWTLALAAAVACGLARDARAGGDENVLLLSGGANVGVSSHDQIANGFVLGAEASLVFLHLGAGNPPPDADAPGVPSGTPGWVGLYTDVVRDTGSDTTRFTIGPELGITVVGVDGGLLAQLGDEGRWGLTVRPVLTLGVLALYGRFGHFMDDLPEPEFFETGLLIKVPLPLWAQGR